ncbi:MAG: NAD(P)-dependent oxidoreductase [Anaerolineaceae bacterium]|nr:NAD(P)-dependent oxidoreductase [Anaerolineaceae bacterium]
MTYQVLFVTHRGERHQQSALAGAPKDLEITFLRDPNKAEIIKHLSEKQFLITERSDIIDAEIIAAGKDLQLIQRLGSQIYDIDLDAARKAGVKVCYMPIEMTVMVSEHMLTQMLSLAKRLREAMHVIIMEKDWGLSPRKSDEDTFAINFTGRQSIGTLYRKTVGIIGFGEIGIELARRLKGFECKVLYHKRAQLSNHAENDLDIQYANQEDLLAQSDFVAMLLPFMPETEAMVNLHFIHQMKPGACLVSCGASGLFNEKDVAEALRSGYLGGVATDTFEWEPINMDSPLLPLARDLEANIILTPHTASGSIDPNALPDRRGDYINLISYTKNKPLIYQIV